MTANILHTARIVLLLEPAQLNAWAIIISSLLFNNIGGSSLDKLEGLTPIESFKERLAGRNLSAISCYILLILPLPEEIPSFLRRNNFFAVLDPLGKCTHRGRVKCLVMYTSLFPYLHVFRHNRAWFVPCFVL